MITNHHHIILKVPGGTISLSLSLSFLLVESTYM